MSHKSVWRFADLTMAAIVGWAKRLVRRSSKSEGGSVPTIHDENARWHGARAPLPTLVIAQSIIVGMFREDWPAAVCTPRQAAGDRIEPTQSS